jgi:hypothetical protein
MGFRSEGEMPKVQSESDYVPLREVARMCGVSVSTIERRFPLGTPGVVNWGTDKHRMLRILRSAVKGEKQRRMGRRK